LSARCAIFPRTPEPSVTTARCLFAAAPGPTLRPAPSASTQTFPTDAARQANFLRCRSADTFQVERCTFFHAPDHSTRTCTRTFARALTRFATAGGVNLPPQTLTAAPILVNASSGLVGCFPTRPCWTVERRHPHELTDMLEAWTKFAMSSTALDVAARAGPKLAEQHGQCVTSLAWSLAIGPRRGHCLPPACRLRQPHVSPRCPHRCRAFSGAWLAPCARTWGRRGQHAPHGAGGQKPRSARCGSILAPALPPVLTPRSP